MAMIVPTVEAVGDEALTNSIIDRSITELQDNIITTLPDNAMQYCKALKKVVFGAASSVGMMAFSNCTSLETADFYEAFTLQTRLFISCGALKALILRGRTVSALANTNAFEKSGIASGTGYIYVPAALVDSYKTAANWSTYANQIRAIEDYPEVCDPYSWEAVSIAIEKGTYKDMYKIGDSVPVDLGSEGIINMQIAAFDAEPLADGSGTAAISWVGKELLNTTLYTWNKKAVRNDDGTYVNGTGTVGGWGVSEIRTYLNTTVKPLVPESVVPMVVGVQKTHRAMDASNNSFSQTTEDEVWIPGKGEVDGGIYKELFPNIDSRIKHYKGFSFGTGWWLRDANYASSVYGINPGGDLTGNPTVQQYSALGVCLGFCTGRTPT